jgi:hypothetical protein
LADAGSRVKAALRRFAILAFLGLAAVCDPTTEAIAGGFGETLDVMMPPNEYIHRYQGKVAVLYLPHKAGNPMLSLSFHGNGQCVIWLPRVGDPEISQELYDCLAVIEVANCNGATDINMPAVRARSSAYEQARYGRTCAHGEWAGAFDAVREPAMTTQTASAGAPLAGPRLN